MNNFVIFKKHKIKRLPINPLELIGNNIKLLSYENFVKYSNMSIDELFEISKEGFTIYKDGFFVIAYNKDVSNVGRRRFTLMHELSHIYLEHIGDNAFNTTALRKNNADIEKEADEFAIEMLCPMAVLHYCAVNTISEIKKMCGVSAKAAAKQLEKLKTLRENRYSFNEPHDKKVLIHFSEFISEQICYQSLKFYKNNERKYKEKALIEIEQNEF